MIKQIMHLMWNTRRKNLLVFIEIFISFLVLFGVYTFLSHGFGIQSVPAGFASDDRYKVNLPFDEDRDEADRALAKSLLRRQLESIPEVNHVSFSNFAVPYSRGAWSGFVLYEGKSCDSYFSTADEYFADVFDLTINRGRWFNGDDQVDGRAVAVVNQLFVDSYAQGDEVVGSTMEREDGEHEIIGVVDHYKYMGDFVEEEPMVFAYSTIGDSDLDHLIVHVKPGTPANFELTLSNILKDTGKLQGFQIRSLEHEQKSANRIFIIPMIILLFLSIFLVINVSLGLFGVVGFNIRRRIQEIGLRQAMGANKNQIILQLLGEQWMIAIAGILLGLLVSVQFPLLKVFHPVHQEYFVGMALAALTIMIVLTVCVAIPSSRATKINPARALHEN